jgi:hypothetical protein
MCTHVYTRDGAIDAAILWYQVWWYPLYPMMSTVYHYYYYVYPYLLVVHSLRYVSSMLPSLSMQYVYHASRMVSCYVISTI